MTEWQESALENNQTPSTTPKRKDRYTPEKGTVIGQISSTCLYQHRQKSYCHRKKIWRKFSKNKEKSHSKVVWYPPDNRLPHCIFRTDELLSCCGD